MTKYCALLLCSAVCLSAAEFRTGQAARAVLGQENFTRQVPGTTDRILGAVGGLALTGDTLIVADSSRLQSATPQNNRVLIYSTVSQMIPAPEASISVEPFLRCPVCQARASVVLGQPDFAKNEIGLTRTGLRNPTSVATDGQYVAVADTDNNRVLIWNSIPTSVNAPADVVIGQPNFTSGGINYGGNGNTPSARGLRGPQGVWIQAGKLYVADTLNHRVLIWNQIPTQNGADASVVLGQAGFAAFVSPDLTQTQAKIAPTSMNTPVAVTSDGERLYVTDLGHNRILIWNTIPTSNQVAADLALGQPDLTTAIANHSSALCESNGTDAKGEKTYPARCAATLDSPRFALSDGRRLFVADGGNDRVLVFNNRPVGSGYRADVVLGQQDEFSILGSTVDFFGAAEFNTEVVGAGSLRTPTSLAWDGSKNLYVADPYNRRIVVFSPGEPNLISRAVRNAASLEIHAVGVIDFSGSIKENDEVTVKIAGKEYKYKVLKDDTFAKVITSLIQTINAGEGDPNVLASPNLTVNAIVLTARQAGSAGEEFEIAVSTSANASIALTASGTKLSGGQDAAKIAPGTIVTIMGQNLAPREARAVVTEENPNLPKTLGGVQVYFDGIAAPLLYVSPAQINAQMPFDVNDATSVTAWVRTIDDNGAVRITTPVAVPIVRQAPGIFAAGGTDPRPAIAYHESAAATGSVALDGIPKENQFAAIKIEDREYRYDIKAGDTIDTVQAELIRRINEGEEKVEAFASGWFTTNHRRVRLRARVPGPEGEGIAYSVATSTDAGLILSPASTALCCAATGGGLITEEQPARPGEPIIVYATGLGFVGPPEALDTVVAGSPYRGPVDNVVNERIDSLAGGKTANVLYAGLKPGTIGIYEVVLQLNPDLPTNPRTQLTIAQDILVSNIVTIPVVNPNPPAE
ncbi:MAG TPA: IPT/TIG domain-containing protein [Bryobacteraceae bacterium]|nr:IPT/TIG domain-containing protein [Bryobacteraceae bacterium]